MRQLVYRDKSRRAIFVLIGNGIFLDFLFTLLRWKKWQTTDQHRSLHLSAQNQKFQRKSLKKKKNPKRAMWFKWLQMGKCLSRLTNAKWLSWCIARRTPCKMWRTAFPEDLITSCKLSTTTMWRFVLCGGRGEMVVFVCMYVESCVEVLRDNALINVGSCWV